MRRLLHAVNNGTKIRAVALHGGEQSRILLQRHHMHELSVALALIDQITEVATPEGIERLTAVHIRVGALSGISPEALTFSWQLAADGTLAAGSTLHVEQVPLVVACDTCHADVQPEPGHGFACPRCGTIASTIRSGRELQLVSMEVPG